MTALRDWRFAVRALGLLALLAGLAAPPVTVRRAVYDVVAVLDITGSMNVADQALDGAPATRIAAEKRAVRRLLADLPCGSRLGLAVFVERQPFLLFEPVETCANFPALDAEVRAVDWRMGWDSESHIAATLLAALRMARGLGADLLFLTDGQETPPLSWDGAPDFSHVRDAVRGTVVGVGGRTPAPIPKFDTFGRQVGFFKPGDVPSEQAGLFRGREHLSAVDEPHLRGLAGETGLAYRHLDGEGTLLDAVRREATRHVVADRVQVAWVGALVCLMLMVSTFFSEEKKQKTFVRLGARWWDRARQMNKSSLVLFFKKELLP